MYGYEMVMSNPCAAHESSEGSSEAVKKGHRAGSKQIPYRGNREARAFLCFLCRPPWVPVQIFKQPYLRLFLSQVGLYHHGRETGQRHSGLCSVWQTYVAGYPLHGREFFQPPDSLPCRRVMIPHKRFRIRVSVKHFQNMLGLFVSFHV
jgi:hypothetical protein